MKVRRIRSGNIREWLKEAGFEDFERKILPDGFSLIERES
jgi:hypothetical protein